MRLIRRRVVDTKVRSNPLRRRLRRIGRVQRCEEALAFIDQYYSENGLSESARRQRKRVVAREIIRYGYYEHTPEELAFGARVAWRNNSRCIGRLLWKSLEVVDCRSSSTPQSIASRMVDHLIEATGNGSIRSVVSIFAPVKGDSLDGDLPAYIESRQIVQYAGYSNEGRVIGDPMNQEITRIAISLGWQPPAVPGPFDPLPLIICDAQGRRLIYEFPRSAVREIVIEHPQATRLRELGLKWYAVPCLSSMILTIGGIDYPCAPFNGHYMSTEIANRDLADERRYDLLPQIADSLGIERDANRESLWKDRALTELNTAILHSFRRDGVTIVDHHAASRQYMMFASREESAGRTPSADWSWIVPPQGASACPVYHLRMKDRYLVPNYYESRGTDGAQLGPSYDDQLRSRARQRWDTARRRWYRWWGRRD